MSDDKFCKLTITSNAGSASYKIRKGFGFQAVSARYSTPIEYDCRDADCGICIIKVLQGHENLSAPNEKESDFLKAMRAEPEERLACQCRLYGDTHVEIEY